MLNGELREAADHSVLGSIRLLTAWFVPLLWLFAVLDWWVFPAPETPEALDVRAFATAVTLAVSAIFAAITLWLRRRPPSPVWANPLAFAIGICGLARGLTNLYVDPDPDRALALAVLNIGAGCVLLSRTWFVLYSLISGVAWYSVAYSQAPATEWSATWSVTVISVAVAFVVLNVRRMSFTEMVTTRALDRRLSAELSTRVRLGEVLVRISARFLSLPHDEFDRAVESTLGELGRALGADHAFLCRLDHSSRQMSIVYEWAASSVDPRKATIRNMSLGDSDWFFQRLREGEMVNITLADSPSSELPPESAFLNRLGTGALLAVPVVQGTKSPWGYLGLAQSTRPALWSPDEANLLHVVGDILLSTMERHVAETRVRLSEARFRSLFDASIIGVFFSSVYGKISDANNAFFEITGYEPADLPLRWDQLTPPEWRSHDEAAVLRLLKYGVDHPWEKELFRKDGSRVPVLVGGAILSHRRGECAAFILDLSQRKDAEEQIQHLNAALERAARIGTMGEMAAGLAHEVHQPIASIANFANGARNRLARGRLSEEELEGVFSEIADQCARAGSVIRNIRDFVRGLNPDRRPVDMNAVVNQSLQLARFDIYQRNVQVESRLAEQLPLVLTDPTQLSQILLNLILNAVQAMGDVPGERKLVIETTVVDDGIVEVRVADTGHGICEADRNRLFDQFFTTKADGMGLGLSIARSIAEDHGGQLELVKSGDSGTEFVLRLPAILSETDIPTVASEMVAGGMTDAG